MKKHALNLFLCFILCLALCPTALFVSGEVGTPAVHAESPTPLAVGNTTAENAVASITQGNEASYFSTLADALGVAENGQTVKLLQNASAQEENGNSKLESAENSAVNRP